MWYTVAAYTPGRGDYGSDWRIIAQAIGKQDAHTIARSVTVTRRYPKAVIFRGLDIGRQVAEYVS